MDRKIIILTGPSAAGKTSIAKNLIQRLGFLSYFISITTRLPRKGEIHGQDYYFTNLEDFNSKIKNNEFIEYEEPYKGKLYGTLYSELDRIWGNQKYPLRVIDIYGAKSLENKFKENVRSIFISPPSLKILEERLILRKSDNSEDIRERILVAEKELSFANNFDKLIINDNLEKATNTTVQIIEEFIFS